MQRYIFSYEDVLLLLYHAEFSVLKILASEQ